MSQNITVEGINPPQRLDRFLKHEFPHIGFSVLQKWMRTGQMRLNGKRVEGASLVKTNDKLRFPPQAELINDNPTRKLIHQINDKTLTILKDNIIFETSDFLAINKPFGLSMQGGTDVKDAVSFYLNLLNNDSAEPLRIVHRLDRDTSGIILLAKSLLASQKLSDALAARNVDKYYLAILAGTLNKQQGTIELPLGKMTGILKEKMSSQATRTLTALTHYHVIDRQDDLTLVCFKPLTGRTHQLRVHSVEGLGYPILGDGKYGGKAAHPLGARDKMHLHAWALSFKEFDQDFKLIAQLSDHFVHTLKQSNFKIPNFEDLELKFTSKEK